MTGDQRPSDLTVFSSACTMLRALRQGQWKLVSAKKGRWELYDLSKDRTEINDLAQAQAERVKTMSDEWFRLAKEVDRLSGGRLAPVNDTLTKLNFRKSTSGGGEGKKKSGKGRKKKDPQ